MSGYPLFNLSFGILWFFLLVAWIWVLIAVVADVFRSDDLSGWGKAGWTLLLLWLPWLGVLVYLVARGNGMRERSVG